MRRLPILMLGTLTLAVGLMPSVAVAQTPTTPSPTARTESSEPEPSSGVLRISPGKGKAGTTITVKSRTRCVDESGKVGSTVEVALYAPAGEPPQSRFYKTVSTKPKGDWGTEVTIPLSAKTGDIFFLDATCSNSTGVVMRYGWVGFTVTGPKQAPRVQPAPDQLKGVFTISPDQGAAGTTITVKSKTNCVDRNGKVGRAVDLTVSSVDAQEPLFDKTAFPNATGGWSIKVTIPSTAKIGEVFRLFGTCWSHDFGPDMGYRGQSDFTVTGAKKAPVAQPVPGDPDYTG